MSEQTTNQRDRIGELAESFVARFRAGERPSIEEYVRRYPNLADELRQLLPALVMLEQHGSVDAGEAVGGRAALRPAPRQIGDFTIVREIGRGGMGIVYEAVQQSLGRHVALKVLSAGGLLNPIHLERFRLEARSAGRLHHSHIVPVFGVGESDGLHYYAMQFIVGQSLDEVISALRRLRSGKRHVNAAPWVRDALPQSVVNGPSAAGGAAEPAPSRSGYVSADTPPSVAPSSTRTHLATPTEFSVGSGGRQFYDSVARVGVQVADALAYAHAEGLLHRDIKPSNLILDAKGNTWVTDFGLVKDEDSQALTETGDFVGTLRYMPPERLEGAADCRSDIYSLGVTLYELLTLRTFFESVNRVQLIDSIRHRQPETPTKIDPAVPRDLETIVLKAISKGADSRYDTADEMAADLRRFLSDQPILARRSKFIERFVRGCRRNPAVASLTAAVGLVLITGTIVSTTQAVRATNAERLAGQRFETEQEARREADKARAAEAKQRQIAEANYRDARTAVDKYFTLVSESKLLNVPGAQPLRKDLLEAAATFYQSASQRRDVDPDVLADLAMAQLRISMIYLALGHSNDTHRTMRSALEVIDRIRQDPQIARAVEPKLAGFYSNLRWQHRYLEPLKDRAGAMQTLQRLENHLRELADRHPTVPQFRFDLAGIRNLISATFELYEPLGSATALWLRQAEDVARQLVSESPDDPEYREALVEITLRAADNFYDTGFGEKAIQAITEARQLSEGLTKEFPDNLVYRGMLAECYSESGRCNDRAHPSEAVANHRRALALTESLTREHPEEPRFLELWADAIRRWKRCSAVNHDDPESQALLNRFLEKSQASKK